MMDEVLFLANLRGDSEDLFGESSFLTGDLRAEELFLSRGLTLILTWSMCREVRGSGEWGGLWRGL